MHLGTSTRVVWHLSTLDAIDFIARAGFESVELWTESPNLCLDQIDAREIDAIRRKLRDSAIGVSVHAPMRDVNLSSLNRGIWRESIRQLKEAVRFTATVGASIVTVHPGKNTSLKDPFVATERIFYEGLDEIVAVAEKQNVTIALENMENRKGEYVVSAKVLRETIERIDSTKLAATFDIAHANTHTSDLVEFCSTIQEHIAHVHVSDNTGETGPTHMEIGTGAINFKSVLSHLASSGFDGALIVEGYFPADPEQTTRRNLQQLQRILQRM